MRLCIAVVGLCVVWLNGCQGDGSSGLFGEKSVDSPAATPHQISRDRAKELAAPYLEESYRLRREHVSSDRRLSNHKPPTDWVDLHGDWYYVTRDDQISMNLNFYRPYAVRVHAETGEVVPPAEPTTTKKK